MYSVLGATEVYTSVTHSAELYYFGMKIKLNVYGLDGTEARELEEFLSAFPDVEDVALRYRTNDSIFQGNIQASAAIPIVKAVITLGPVAWLGKKMLDDAYEVLLKEAWRKCLIDLKTNVTQWVEQRNAEREPRSRIHFTMLEEDEPLARLVTDADRD